MGAGTQASTSASTPALLAALKALRPSVRTSQLRVPGLLRTRFLPHVRARLPRTCSTPSGHSGPQLSRYTPSSRGRHCRIAPAVISRFHVIMTTHTGVHFPPSAVRPDYNYKNVQNYGGATYVPYHTIFIGGLHIFCSSMSVLLCTRMIDANFNQKPAPTSPPAHTTFYFASKTEPRPHHNLQ